MPATTPPNDEQVGPLPAERTVAGPDERGADEPPLVACSLSAGSQRERLEQWHVVLGAATLEHTSRGVVAELPIAAVRELTALIIAEQECCPFFAFELAFRGQRLRLSIAADDPALVAELLPAESRR
jgi:MerR family transcriptional regulator, copper efflux regulator